jgi:hypothetical protein
METIKRIQEVTDGMVTANDFVDPRLSPEKHRIREFAVAR